MMLVKSCRLNFKFLRLVHLGGETGKLCFSNYLLLLRTLDRMDRQSILLQCNHGLAFSLCRLYIRRILFEKRAVEMVCVTFKELIAGFTFCVTSRVLER